MGTFNDDDNDDEPVIYHHCFQFTWVHTTDNTRTQNKTYAKRQKMSEHNNNINRENEHRALHTAEKGGIKLWSKQER